MIPFAFLISVVFICISIGYSFEKLVLRLKCCNENEEINILNTPVVGLAVLLGFCQILYLAMPTKYIGLLVWLLFFISLAFNKIEFLSALAKYLKDNIALLIVVIIIIAIYAWPMLENNQLMSYQYSNNDIIYYLATDDRMSDHSFFDVLQYASDRPYFAVVKAIIGKTRFGTDAVESTFMSMFALDSYQVFTSTGIIYILFSFLGLYDLTSRVFDLSKKKWIFVIMLAPMAMHASWKELLVKGYIPQLAGICFLLWFIDEILKYYNSRSKLNGFHVSLLIAAILCSYAEYASYVFFIFCGVLIISIIENRNFLLEIKDAIIIAIEGIILNPLGFIVAAKFNYNTFNNVKHSGQSIDAFQGNMRSKANVVAEILGVIGSNQETDVYAWGLVCTGIVIVAIIICYAIRKRNATTYEILWLCGFFALYELYFRFSHIAYAEYKHLVGIGPIIVAIAIGSLYELFSNKKIVQKIAIACFCSLLTVGNIFNMVKINGFRIVNLYDDYLADIANGLKLIPDNEKIGIYGDGYFLQHEMIYAARNHKMQLMGTLPNSYYLAIREYNITCDNEYRKYLLMPENSPYVKDLPYDYRIIWNNGHFKIISEVSKFKSYIIGSKIYFSGPDWDCEKYIKYGISGNEKEFTWTNGKEIAFTPIRLIDKDITGDSSWYEMEIGIYRIFGESQEIIMMINGEKIWSGQVNSAGMIKIPFKYVQSGIGNDLINISIQLPDAISPLEIGYSTDSRKLGIAINEMCIKRLEHE